MERVKLRKYLLILSICTFSLMAASYFKILDKKYFITILYINMMVQGLVIILYYLNGSNKKTKNVKIMRCEFRNKFIRDLLPEYIYPTSPRNPAIFKIYLETDEFTKDDNDFFVDIIGGNGETIQNVNSRVLYIKTKVATDIFVFNAEIKIFPNEKINFRFRKDANVKIFTMEEVYIL